VPAVAADVGATSRVPHCQQKFWSGR
jgi:hypothetical protein